jgi:hypothetical protein
VKQICILKATEHLFDISVAIIQAPLSSESTTFIFIKALDW